MGKATRGRRGFLLGPGEQRIDLGNRVGPDRKGEPEEKEVYARLRRVERRPSHPRKHYAGIPDPDGVLALFPTSGPARCSKTTVTDVGVLAAKMWFSPGSVERICSGGSSALVIWILTGTRFLSAAGIPGCASAMRNLLIFSARRNFLNEKSPQKEMAESDLARSACIKSCDAMERMRKKSVVER